MGFGFCRGWFDRIRRTTDSKKNNQYWYDSLETKDLHNLNNPVK